MPSQPTLAGPLSPSSLQQNQGANGEVLPPESEKVSVVGVGMGGRTGEVHDDISIPKSERKAQELRGIAGKLPKGSKEDGKYTGLIEVPSLDSIEGADNGDSGVHSEKDGNQSGQISSATSSLGENHGNRTLYLGNLHPFVTEDTLREVFHGCEGVTELKVIRDKVTQVSAGYGFARFTDQDSAGAALEKVGKCILFGQEARINWAFQRDQQEDLANHIHVFVGDLSPEISDAALLRAFQNSGCSDARVQWDHATGRSRGYGFVSFRSREMAEAAIARMHGQVVGGRRIRCGWAQHKADPAIPLDAEALDRADPTNTNIYVGNLVPSVSETELRRAFGSYGPIAEVKLHRKGAFGFVRFRLHNDAVRAIIGMNGAIIGGKSIKCSWGRHPAVLPSGMQANLMLAAAAGMGPLAIQAPGVPMNMGGMLGMPMAQNATGAILQPTQGAPSNGIPQLAGMPGQPTVQGASGDAAGHGLYTTASSFTVPPGMQYPAVPQMYYSRSPAIQL